MKVRVRVVQNFVGREVIKAHQPVGLIEPVLAQERRARGQRGQAAVAHHRHIGREEHALEAVFFVERAGQPDDLTVGFGRRADDHLRALSGWGEAGRVPVERHFVLRLFDAVGDLSHRAQHVLAALVGRKALETLLRGQLDVDAQPVGQLPQPPEQPLVRAGDALGVDIAAEAVFLAQDRECFDHQLGGVVGIFNDARAEKQPLDVVAPIEGDGQVSQLAGRERGTRRVVGAAVDAIGAVVAAGVAHEHLEQRYATPVRRKAVADAAGH